VGWGLPDGLSDQLAIDLKREYPAFLYSRFTCYRGGVGGRSGRSGRGGRPFDKGLYAAIGEPDNRHRKPTSLPRPVERLMVLDAVLADRDRTWLATGQDKRSHFTITHRIPPQDLSSLIFRAEDTETVRDFPDRLPIGVDRDGEDTSGEAARAGRFSGLLGTAHRTAARTPDVDDPPGDPAPFHPGRGGVPRGLS
jgi:hypothetical protein